MPSAAKSGVRVALCSGDHDPSRECVLASLHRDLSVRIRQDNNVRAVLSTGIPGRKVLCRSGGRAKRLDGNGIGRVESCARGGVLYGVSSNHSGIADLLLCGRGTLRHSLCGAGSRDDGPSRSTNCLACAPAMASGRGRVVAISARQLGSARAGSVMTRAQRRVHAVLAPLCVLAALIAGVVLWW